MMEVPTRSGRTIRLDQVRPDELDIMDIAWSLAHQNRFSGHGGQWSVATHSVFVSRLVSEENAKAALMHDATEFGVGDLATPIKRLCPAFEDLEHNLWLVVAERFGLPKLIPDEVHAADKACLVAEAEQLFGLDWSEQLGHEPAPITIEELTPWQSYTMFIARFIELFGDLTSYCVNGEITKGSMG